MKRNLIKEEWMDTLHYIPVLAEIYFRSANFKWENIELIFCFTNKREESYENEIKLEWKIVLETWLMVFEVLTT